MATYQDRSGNDLGHYVSVMRQHWRPIFVGALIGLLVAAAVLGVLGGRFTATTDVNINVISTDPFDAQRSASGLLDGATEAQIARSYAVATMASDSLDSEPSAEELRQGSDVSTIADATIIRISYTASSQADARAGADALADAYLAYRATHATNRVEGVIERIDQRLSTLRQELTDANTRAAAAEGGSTEANQAASDRELITIEIDSLLEQKNALALIDTEGGSVLSTAKENEVTPSLNPALILLSGLLAGAIIGVVAAFVINSGRRRVSTVQDVEQATGVRVLTSLTAKAATIPADGSSLDQLRTARERINAALGANSRVIVVFDYSGGPQPSDVPVNLAATFAQDGQLTHLVLPGYPQRYVQLVRESLDLAGGDQIEGGTTYSRAGGALRLHLPDPENAGADRAALIAGFVRGVVAAASPADVVVIALPPGVPHSSGLAAGRLASALTVVVGLGTTTASDITALFEEPALIDAEFLGAIAVPGKRRLHSPFPDKMRT